MVDLVDVGLRESALVSELIIAYWQPAAHVLDFAIGVTYPLSRPSGFAMEVGRDAPGFMSTTCRNSIGRMAQ